MFVAVVDLLAQMTHVNVHEVVDVVVVSPHTLAEAGAGQDVSRLTHEHSGPPHDWWVLFRSPPLNSLVERTRAGQD
jgi:hypothetical protein